MQSLKANCLGSVLSGENRAASHYDGQGAIKNAYELLNLRALNIWMLYKNHILQCMGMIGYLWNSTKNIYPHIESCRFYTQVKI